MRQEGCTLCPVLQEVNELQVSGEFIFKGPRDQLWELLNDPGVLARCTPGCERLDLVGPDEYRAVLKVGLAAVKGTYEGIMRIANRVEPESLVLQIEASGSTGFVNVNGRMDLAEQGADTRLTYDWSVAVGGPVAMVGQRVLGGVARWIIGDFFGAVQKELALRQKEGAD